MNKISINGHTYEVSGRNISVVNDKVYVNGKLIESNLTGTVDIRWEGEAANIDCTNITVNGNVGGSIDCNNIIVNGDVSGDIDGTNVKCGNVGGSIDAVSVTKK